MPVILDVDDSSVATLLLDRPHKRNALDREMLDSLLDATGQLARRTDVRAVIVRFAAVAALDVPSVALIEGAAVGGGFELALACDVRIAASDALIGFPELRLGNLPAWGGLARLIGITGLGAARHLLLTGELVDGIRAATLGVVTAVADPNDLSAELARIVNGFTACEPTALALAKQVLTGFAGDLPLEPAIASYTAGLDSSRRRKQDFLDRKAARKIGVSS
jgi:enoyl-CoA hydratase/carnithine racemase